MIFVIGLACLLVGVFLLFTAEAIDDGVPGKFRVLAGTFGGFGIAFAAAGIVCMIISIGLIMWRYLP